MFECLENKLTPTYAKIKIKNTNKAATKTKEQSQTLRIKNELKYLQIKKSEINKQLILPSERWSQNIREKVANYWESNTWRNQAHNKYRTETTTVRWKDGGK